MFDVASGNGTVGGVELSGENVTDPSEGVPESFVTSDGLSTLEGVAQGHVDERFVSCRIGSEGEGMVRLPPVEELLLEEPTSKERKKYYPSQSARSLLKEYFELNPPTHL